MAELRRLQVGDPVRTLAADHNATMRAVEQAHAQRHARSHAPIARNHDYDEVLVKNDSGADCARFDVLEVSTPVFSPSSNPETFDEKAALIGVTPTAPFRPFCVLLEPVVDGGIAKAVMSGVMPCTINVNDITDTWADTNAGNHYLQSGTSGQAKIISKDSGTGVVRAVVRLSNYNDAIDPYNVQRFMVISTWQWNGYDQQYALAYRMYYDPASDLYLADSSQTYTIYTTVVNAWDLYYNTESSPAIHDVVIAYHRHDSDRWEVIQNVQNTRRTAKVYEDWQAPTGSEIFPSVQVQLVNDDTLATMTDPITAIIPVAWNKDYLTKPAPELFVGDYCQVGVTPQWGNIEITGPLSFSYLQQSLDYCGSVTNIPDGWALEDGSPLPADKKIPLTNAPDSRGRFIIGVDPADSAGDGSENTIGDTGGYRWHGLSENNHDNHMNHRHMIDDNTRGTADVAAGSDATVIKAIPTPWTSGAANLSGETGNVLEHTVPNCTTDDDTDNRPRFYAKAKIIRYK